MEEKHQRESAVRDQVDIVLDEQERNLYFDTLDQVTLLGGEASDAFFFGLIPRLDSPEAASNIDHVALSQYLRYWRTSAAWMNQTKSAGVADVLRDFERKLNIG